MPSTAASTCTGQTAPLRVLIAGGGVGGLCAAVALRQQGHQVEVFEKAKEHTEVGAAVYCAPNCTAALKHIDIDPATIGGVPHNGIKFLDSNCQVTFTHTYSSEERSRWRAEWFLFNRIDLHDALKAKALAPAGPGVPVKLHTASPVTGIDGDRAAVTLATGASVAGDVVVGADGIFSKTRACVTGREAPLFSSGKCCFRALVPAEALLADAETRVFADPPGTFMQVAASDRRICLYPCSAGRLINVAAFVPRGEVGEIKKGLTGYDQSANKKQLMDHFRDFARPVRGLLDKAPDNGVRLWDLLDMELQPRVIKGRAVLIGDAAHPFLPHMGQGAAQAIEDACALGALMPAGTRADEIPRRLELWQQCRLSRAHKVVEMTRHRAREADGSQGPPQTVAEFNAAMQYCVDHDAWEHAEETMRAWERAAQGNHARAGL